MRAFVMQDGETEEIIREFKNLTETKSMPYSEKRIKLLSLAEKMDEYLISIPKSKLNEEYKEEFYYKGIYFVHPYNQEVFI